MCAIENVGTSLEAIEYLTRSPSRIEVLDAIDETPRERHELKGITDVSRVTLSRILANLEGRNWIERSDGQYETTERGTFVVRELMQLLANMQTLDELDGVIEWLPIEEFAFELTCLRDAEVTTSSWSDHTASIRRVAELIHRADRIRGTASGVSREVVDALRDAVVHGDGSVEVVLDPTALDIVRGDAELRGLLTEMVGAGGDVNRYDGEDVLLMVMICDDVVLVCGHDEDGPPPGTLETTNEAVRSWAESYFASVRADARPLDAEAFTS